MDMKFQLAFSAAFTEKYTVRKYIIPASAIGSSNLFSAVGVGIINAPVSAVTSASGYGMLELETVFTATAAGTFSFQWAQNTSDAGNLTVIAGSDLEYTTI
jgi:hypothetical protein